MKLKSSLSNSICSLYIILKLDCCKFLIWIGWPTYWFRLLIWNWQWRTLQTLIILMIVICLASSKQSGPYSRHSVPSCVGHRKPWPRAWPRSRQIDNQDIDQSDYYNDYQQKQWDSPCGNDHTHSQPDLRSLETCNFGVLLAACFLGAMQILSWFIDYSKQMSACLSFTAFRKLTDNLCSGLVHGAGQLGAWCNIHFISMSQTHTLYFLQRSETLLIFYTHLWGFYPVLIYR